MSTEASTPCYQWQGETLILRILLQPRASRDEIVGVVDAAEGSALKVRITAPPVDGRANTHLIRFLARKFDLPASRVTLIAGQRGRHKRLALAAPGRLPAGIVGPE